MDHSRYDATIILGNSYRLISSKVTNYKKGKNSETTDQNKSDINVKYIFEDKDFLKEKAM